jgi:polar amino acid transport system substrate-binding protein
MRNRLRGGFLAAALGLAACSAAAPQPDPVAASKASPVMDRILQRGEIVIGTTGSQPPLNARDKNGELIGLEADLARLMAVSLGVKEKMIAMPFAELLPALQAGKVDVVMSGVTMTPERNKKVAFVGPYFVSGTSMLTRSQSVKALSDTGNLNNPKTRLAALRGSTSQRVVEDLLSKATLELVDGYDVAVERIIKGDLDALIADHLYCVLAALRNRDKGLTTLMRPLTFEPIGVALPPNDPLLMNWMDNFFLTLEGTGVLPDLTAAWLDDPAWLQDLGDTSDGAE